MIPGDRNQNGQQALSGAMAHYWQMALSGATALSGAMALSGAIRHHILIQPHIFQINNNSIISAPSAIIKKSLRLILINLEWQKDPCNIADLFDFKFFNFA